PPPYPSYSRPLPRGHGGAGQCHGPILLPLLRLDRQALSFPYLRRLWGRPGWHGRSLWHGGCPLRVSLSRYRREPLEHGTVLDGRRFSRGPAAGHVAVLRSIRLCRTDHDAARAQALHYSALRAGEGVACSAGLSRRSTGLALQGFDVLTHILNPRTRGTL